MLDDFCFYFDLLLLDIMLIHNFSMLADCTRAWFLSGGVRFHVSSEFYLFPR